MKGVTVHLLSVFIFNYALVSAVAAILLAQLIKIPLHFLYHREWDFKRFIGTGGMPSSHSAGVTALASAIGYQDGVQSTDFALACVLGMVVMYDAMGIRRHAGEQAMAINQLEQEFKQHIETRDPEYSKRAITHRRKHLKELLGHQPIEVAAGAAFGVVVGLLFHFFY
jgi:acid phosphatase family membrane protein YuiD